jgi:hypothetical protein
MSVISSTERWSTLCDVMHRLSPTAWKIVTLIARDDLTRLADENSAESALRRDIFTMGGIDTSQPADVDERSAPTMVQDPSAKWTRLSLAEICCGVRDRGKRIVKNRGTGLAKSSAVNAIGEAVRLGVLKRRRHSSEMHGNLPTSYSIDWKRTSELAEESKRWSNVKTTNKFGRPLPPKVRLDS